jgi:hypothetical protein
VLAHHPKNLYGNNSPLGDLGSVIIAVGVGVTLILLRRRPPEVRALGVLCAVLACTAGFGVQYLLWVAPLAIAISGVWRYGYVLAATGWAITIYVLPIHAPGWQNDIALLSWIPASMLVALIVEQVRRASPELADRDDGSRAGAASLVIRASTGG